MSQSGVSAAPAPTAEQTPVAGDTENNESGTGVPSSAPGPVWRYTGYWQGSYSAWEWRPDGQWVHVEQLPAPASSPGPTQDPWQQERDPWQQHRAGQQQSRPWSGAWQDARGTWARNHSNGWAQDSRPKYVDKEPPPAWD